MIDRYWSDLIKNLEAYAPGEQPQDQEYIKLNTNENPYPPSPKALNAIKEQASQSLRRYPDPDSMSAKRSIADYFNLSESEVFIGNGSDEVLAFSFIAFFKQAYPILFPEITYSFYPVYSSLFEIAFKQVPLSANFQINIKDYEEQNGGIIIANPNAPTGLALAQADIKSLLTRNQQSVVIIDEAYVDFGAESAARLIKNYDNLLVIQTCSKSRSLAGLRIGYALGNPDLITGLQKVKNSFNCYPVDQLAAAAAQASFEDQDYFAESCQKVIATRAKLITALDQIGFNTLDSKANFVLTKHPHITGRNLYSALKEEGILVRHFDTELLTEYVRISIGTDHEIGVLIDTLRNLLN